MKKKVALIAAVLMLGVSLAAYSQAPDKVMSNKYWRSSFKDQVLLQSKDGVYKLVFEKTGDLVILKHDKKIWSAGTDKSKTGKRVGMVWFNPRKGNLEVVTSSKKVIWSTYTTKKRPRLYALTLNGYGMLFATDRANRSIWSINSNTGKTFHCSPRLR